MKWFKHMTNAHEDPAIELLMEEFGPAGYAYFFLLVGLCTSKYEGNRVFTFRLHARTLWTHVRVKPNTGRRLLNLCQTSKLFQFSEDGNVFEIEWPKLAKFLHRDAISSGQRSASGGPDSSPTRIEEKREEKNRGEESAGAPSPSRFETISLERKREQLAAQCAQSIWNALQLFKPWQEAEAIDALDRMAVGIVNTSGGWRALAENFREPRHDMKNNQAKYINHWKQLALAKSQEAVGT